MSYHCQSFRGKTLIKKSTCFVLINFILYEYVDFFAATNSEANRTNRASCLFCRCYKEILHLHDFSSFIYLFKDVFHYSEYHHDALNSNCFATFCFRFCSIKRQVSPRHSCVDVSLSIVRGLFKYSGLDDKLYLFCFWNSLLVNPVTICHLFS